MTNTRSISTMEQSKPINHEHILQVFEKYATGRDDNGEPYMTYNDFIQTYIGLLPPSIDTTEISSSTQAIIDKFASIVDTGHRGSITFHNFKAFEALLKSPDVLYRVAFRLFDSTRVGKISFDDVKTLFSRTTRHQQHPFNWDCELIKESFGKDKSLLLEFGEFSMFLNKMGYEHAKQRYLTEQDQQGAINASQLSQLMREMRPQRLTDFMKIHLEEFVTVDGSHFIKYQEFVALNSLLDNIEMCRRVFDKLLQRTGYFQDTERAGRHGISETLFLQEALRTSNLTPMEVQVLFKLVRLLRNNESDVSGDCISDYKIYKTDFHQIAPLEECMLPKNIAHVNQEDTTKKDSRGALIPILEGAYRFLLGTIAGMAGCIIVYPIDLVKTRMQNQRSSGAYAGQQLYKSPWGCFKHVWKYEGIRGLYRGIIAQLIGVGPEKALKLVVNDTVRDWVRVDGEVPLWGQLAAGATAGGSQVLVTNPLEIVKIRLQTATETGETTNAVKVVKELGFKGLYKGASACFLRDIPFSFIYFPCYSALKYQFLNVKSFVSKDGTLNQLGWLLAGMGAGAPAAYLTTPADVIKTRLQVRSRTDGATNYSGLIQCAKTIHHEEGFRAFFKGGPLRVFRSSPQFGVTLLAYEQLQSLGRQKSSEWFHGSQPIGSHAQVRSIHISQLPPLNKDHIGGYKVAAATYAGVENKFGLEWPR